MSSIPDRPTTAARLETLRELVSVIFGSYAEVRTKHLSELACRLPSVSQTKVSILPLRGSFEYCALQSVLKGEFERELEESSRVDSVDHRVG